MIRLDPLSRLARVALLAFCAMVEWFLCSDGCICRVGVGYTLFGGEIPAIMTIACPLCANTHDMLSQPSSIRWKQVSCGSCDANLVLVRETVAGTPWRTQPSRSKLKPTQVGAIQLMGIVRSRLFIIVATALALGILGYLSWDAGFLESDGSSESSASPSAVPPPTSPPN
jgi:hypothetical protein